MLQLGCLDISQISSGAEPQVDDVHLAEEGQQAAPSKRVLEGFVHDSAQYLDDLSDARLIELEVMLAHALVSREHAQHELAPRLYVTSPCCPACRVDLRRWLRVPLGLHDSQQILLLDVTTRWRTMDS